MSGFNKVVESYKDAMAGLAGHEDRVLPVRCIAAGSLSLSTLGCDDVGTVRCELNDIGLARLVRRPIRPRLVRRE